MCSSRVSPQSSRWAPGISLQHFLPKLFWTLFGPFSACLLCHHLWSSLISYLTNFSLLPKDCFFPGTSCCPPQPSYGSDDYWETNTTTLQLAAQPPCHSQPLHAAEPTTALFSPGSWLDADPTAVGMQEYFTTPCHRF